MAGPISIVSICRGLPTPDNPTEGIFVLRRLEAMSRQAHLTTLQPIPYFPVVAPLPDWATVPQHTIESLQIEHAPMFYVPKFLKSLDGGWLYRSVYSKLAALRQSGRLDIVDAHFAYPEGVGAYRAARKIGVPVIVTLRGFEAEYIHKPFIGSQIRQLLRNADGCICVAHFLRELAVENGARPENTRVIHNAIDRGKFHPASQAEARRKLNLPDNMPIIISIGHLTARKRHHVMIAAFERVLARFPETKLLIAGAKTFEPDYPRQLTEQTKRLGITDSVIFLGNVAAGQIADYLCAADMFALATQREGCCNALLEALACGLPVVTTPVGDNAWFVNEGENGFLVPVDDVEAMAQAMTAVLDRHDWDRDRISRKLEVGNWENVSRDVLEFMTERVGSAQIA